MSRRTIPIKVKSKDLSHIGELLRGGVQQVGVVLRALSLRQLADGFSAPRVAQALPLTSKAVRQIAHRYMNDGLDAAVYAKQRPGAQEILDGPQKQRVVAMVCSKPPEGRARWTVRLIAEEAVKRKLVPKVGRETIRILLQSHELKPWREKNVVHRRVGPGVHPEDGRRAGRLREALQSRPTGPLPG
jgi:transposase